MCPNCILNKAAIYGYLGPGLIIGLFAFLAWSFYYTAKQAGEFEGDEEDPKHIIFDD